MTIPTNFYTQQASLLPQGLQSLISSGQLAPTATPQIPQQPMGNPQLPPYAQSVPMLQQPPINWNQVAQQAAPIYQPPAPPPAPVQAPQPVQPNGLGQSMVRPWQGNSLNHLSIQ